MVTAKQASRLIRQMVPTITRAAAERAAILYKDGERHGDGQSGIADGWYICVHTGTRRSLSAVYRRLSRSPYTLLFDQPSSGVFLEISPMYGEMTDADFARESYTWRGLVTASLPAAVPPEQHTRAEQRLNQWLGELEGFVNEHCGGVDPTVTAHSLYPCP